MLTEREDKRFRAAQAHAATPRFVRELRRHEHRQINEAERAQIKASESRATLDRFTALVKALGDDLRRLHAIGLQTSRRDPRWEHELHTRARKALTELVRMIDADRDGELPEITDAATAAAVERMMLARNKAAPAAGMTD